jgi:hypothetical protein
LGREDLGNKVGSPLAIANNEAISNSSSPIENEKLRSQQEAEANVDKIEL